MLALLGTFRQRKRTIYANDLSFAEDERLQFALEVGDAELDGVLARIERDLELRTLPDVADADDVPGRLGRFARAERADERELVGQPLREDGPVANKRKTSAHFNQPKRSSFVSLSFVTKSVFETPNFRFTGRFNSFESQINGYTLSTFSQSLKFKLTS